MTSRHRIADTLPLLLLLNLPAIACAAPPVPGAGAVNAAPVHSIGAPVSVSQAATAGGVGKKAAPLVLYAEQWEMKRSGDRVLALPVLQKLVHAWLSDRTKIIEIQYPGGEEGEFWVQELSDWLVALGIPSKQMTVIPGSGGDDIIRFDLRRS